MFFGCSDGLLVAGPDVSQQAQVPCQPNHILAMLVPFLYALSTTVFVVASAEDLSLEQPPQRVGFARVGQHRLVLGRLHQRGRPRLPV